MTLSRIVLFLFPVFLSACAQTMADGDLPLSNRFILREIQKMPRGGGYSATDADVRALGHTVSLKSGKLHIVAEKAKPSFCSGATYLVWLRALESMEAAGYLHLTPVIRRSLLIHEQPDGTGVWGRWNANGPGTAKLFHDAGLGKTFEDLGQARPGDFLKIFWTDEIGRKEFGHLVVFLDRFQKEGKSYVQFWSSNQPGGYGEKTIPVSKIRWALVSRFTKPHAISRLPELAASDPFLAQMLTQSFSRHKVRQAVGLR